MATWGVWGSDPLCPGMSLQERARQVKRGSKAVEGPSGKIRLRSKEMQGVWRRESLVRACACACAWVCVCVCVSVCVFACFLESRQGSQGGLGKVQEGFRADQRKASCLACSGRGECVHIAVRTYACMYVGTTVSAKRLCGSCRVLILRVYGQGLFLGPARAVFFTRASLGLAVRHLPRPGASSRDAANAATPHHPAPNIFHSKTEVDPSFKNTSTLDLTVPSLRRAGKASNACPMVKLPAIHFPS